MDVKHHTIGRWLIVDHLPEHLREIAEPYRAAAEHTLANTASGPEQSVAIRKLVEAKDAAVRARIAS